MLKHSMSVMPLATEIKVKENNFSICLKKWKKYWWVLLEDLYYVNFWEKFLAGSGKRGEFVNKWACDYEHNVESSLPIDF